MNTFVSRWRSLSGPTKVGISFALLGGLMAGIGWLVNPQFATRTLISFVLAVGISSIVWGVVAWAIATAAFDVERDVEEAQPENEQQVHR